MKKYTEMTREELEQHEPWQHPEFKVKVMMNPHPVLIATLFSRLKAASEEGRKFSMILGNPEPETYIPLAQLINYFQVDCSKVHIFAEDEWADDAGNIAPETYEAGFVHLLLFQTDRRCHGRRRGYYFHFPGLDGTCGIHRSRFRFYDG